MADYERKIQQTKVDAINELKEEFSQVEDFIFTDYRGLTVEQITELRNKLREEGATFKVVKNRFAKIALSELGRPDVGDKLVGPTAIALTGADSGSVAKILFDYAKDAPLEVKGGIVAGDVYDVSQVEAFSKLPTRTELIAKLMGTLNAPIQNMVYLLNAVPETFVRTLQAVADSKK